MNKKVFLAPTLLFTVAGFMKAQSTAPTNPAPTTSQLFHATETSRTIQAVDYKYHGDSTILDFAGTSLMKQSSGHAKIKSKAGSIQIIANLYNLQPPTSFGAEYLTYVMWAISPDGQVANLGEVVRGSDETSKLEVTTNLQAFALIVTAEPYYAVREPSNVVVLENVVRPDTKGTTEAVKYQLIERGGYVPTGYTFDPVVMNAGLPLEFYEARNAIRIAKSEGAEQYAPDSYQRASKLMDQVNTDATQKHVDKKVLITAARQAVQSAEDARTEAIKKMADVRLANERQAAAAATAQAQQDAATQAENARRQKAESDAATAKAQADSAQAQANAAKAQSDAQAAAADAQAKIAANQAAADAAVAAAKAEADKSRAAAEQAQQQAQQAEADKAAMRAKLSAQLNSILQTRDSARGLIVSMSGVLFQTGQYALKPEAREKLAKVSGILLAYPSLNVEVDGYTDNVGGATMNQTLSEHRADTVRDYLVQQGVASNSVTSKGFGDANPVAPNTNLAGRKANRRVELVVSGDAIGKSKADTSATPSQPAAPTESAAPDSKSSDTSTN